VGAGGGRANLDQVACMCVDVGVGVGRYEVTSPSASMSVGKVNVKVNAHPQHASTHIDVHLRMYSYASE
jgi:hypothetical protein